MLLLTVVAAKSSVAFAESTFTPYTVKNGDTLQTISKEFLGSPEKWRDIWKLNPALSDPNRISAGLKIRIPTEISQIESTGNHVVKSGETLGSIALQYFKNANEWRKIAAANPELKNPSSIKQGQVLAIPDIGANLTQVNNQTAITSSKLDQKAPELENFDQKSQPDINLTFKKESLHHFNERFGIFKGDSRSHMPKILELSNSSGSQMIFADTQDFMQAATAQSWKISRFIRTLGNQQMLVQFIGTADLVGSERNLLTLEVKSLMEPLRLQKEELYVVPAESLDNRITLHGSNYQGELSLVRVFYNENDGPVAIISGGRDKGISIGETLRYYKADRVGRLDDGTVVEWPTVEAGTLVVFRVSDSVAFAKIVRSIRAPGAGDKVKAN